jgi:uncharacterized protein
MMSEYPPEWDIAIEQFQTRAYYACHDTLEALWIDAIEPDKRFYQGVLQIAVACYHLHNANQRGALVLLGEGMGRLKYYTPDYAGIDVEQLLAGSYRLLQELQLVSSDAIDGFVATIIADPALLPTIARSS